MAVLGRNAYILSYTGATAEVNAFTPDHAAMTIQIVDAAVQYECAYNGIMYIMVIRNALYVPSMQHNLMPPFMIREAVIVVNDTPKIYNWMILWQMTTPYIFLVKISGYRYHCGEYSLILQPQSQV